MLFYFAIGEDNIDLYDDVYTQVATKLLGRVIVAWKFVDCATNPLGIFTIRIFVTISIMHLVFKH